MTLWSDGTEWYWASDLAHLGSLILQFTGDNYEAMTGDSLKDCWYIVSDDSGFVMWSDEPEDLPNPLPDGADVTHGVGGWKCTAKVSAWREISKPGFFATTEH